MDGQKDGWIMDKWTDVWMDGWKEGQTGRWMDD